MMILNAYFGRQWHNAESTEEVAGLVLEVIAAPSHERPPQGVSADTFAKLCFAAGRFDHASWTTKGAKGNLIVAENEATGYGALMWYWGGDDPVWVSDNPQPPDFDPRVVADPGNTFHEASSVLPFGQFREVLEEFCHAGTGERPTSIGWVHSDICGRRMDGGFYDRVEVTSDRFEDLGIRRGLIGHVIGQMPDGELWVKFVYPDGLTGADLTTETRDLRLLTRGAAGFWPSLHLIVSSSQTQSRGVS